MTRIGQRITKAIEDRAIHGRFGRSYCIKDLAQKLRVTGEQTRRYIRGIHIPPADQLKKICKELDIPYDEAVRLVEEDRMYYAVNQTPINNYPGLQAVCMLWLDLSEQARNHLVVTAHSLTQRRMAAAG